AVKLAPGKVIVSSERKADRTRLITIRNLCSQARARLAVIHFTRRESSRAPFEHFTLAAGKMPQPSSRLSKGWSERRLAIERQRTAHSMQPSLSQAMEMTASANAVQTNRLSGPL